MASLGSRHVTAAGAEGVTSGRVPSGTLGGSLDGGIDRHGRLGQARKSEGRHPVAVPVP